jgi:hypothetical protein
MIQDAHGGFQPQAKEWPQPYIIAKLGVGLPGLPVYAGIQF